MKYIVSQLLLILFVGCVNAQPVDVNQFEEGLKNTEVQLLDVRTAEEFAEGHIEGAMLADIYDDTEFGRRVAALDRDKPVYVYCLGGARSADAATVLAEKGFKTVVDLKGGFKAWRASEKPVVGLAETPVISPEEFAGLAKSSQNVLVAFSAKWCPPCRKMAPVLEALQQDYFDSASRDFVKLVTIDASTQPALMKLSGVTQMPTFILYRGGKEQWRATGIVDEASFRLHLKKHLEN